MKNKKTRRELKSLKDTRLLLSLIIAVLLVAGVLAWHSSRVSGVATSRPLVGAIRWDAWYTGGPAQSDEVALSPTQWHDRIPFYAAVQPDNSVQIRLDNQSDMDREINYAKAGGLDYWAFDYYGDNSTLTGALHKYMASPYKANMKFNLLLLTQAFQAADWPTSSVNYMKDPQYVTVLNGRPLVYIYTDGSSINANTITQFRNAATAAGLPNPYIVWMTWNPNDGKTTTLGLDAVSAYAHAPTGTVDTVVPYSNLSSVNQQSWNTAKSLDLQSVPLVSTGWDPRPRYANPPPWDPNPSHSAVTTGSPAEIAANLQSAHDWIKNNPFSASANAIIMYAWNEFAEGGWLDPLLQSGSARLDALKPVIDSWNSGDSAPPSITINSPISQSTVSNVVSINSTATDDIAVGGVQYLLDGQRLGQEVTAAPFGYSWNSRTVSNGTHILSALVRDSSGNTATSSSTAVVVNNASLTQPAGNWKFNESTGLTASDSSGNGNNGALAGGSSWVSGNTSNAISLNGVDGYVSVPDSANLDNTEALTVSTWVKLTQLPTQNYVVVGKDSNGASYRITIGGGGGVSFTVQTTNNGWYTAGTNISSVTNISANTWAHIVGTYDGIYLKLYINGRLERTNTQAISGNIYNSASALRFGYKSASNIDYTKGLIDQTYVYPVALNAAEVLGLYQAPSAPVTTIIQPANNQTVSGNVTVSANATDPTGISKVDFYVDGVLKASDSLAPYSYQLDTAGYANNSSHNILVRSYDITSDNSASSITINIGDAIPPTVSLTYPANGSSVPRHTRVTITANASDLSGVSKVEFLVNNKVVCTDKIAPYSCIWSVPSLKNVKYTLQAKAYDTVGNISSAYSTVITQ